MANPYFNAVYYLQQNPDVFSAGYTVATAWDHYVKHGASEANVTGGTFRAPNPWFDVKYYLANNPDLVRAGITPATALDHFLTYGSTAGEDRAPNAAIAAAPITEAKLLAYALANADLQTAFGISASATTLTAAQQTSLLNHFYAYGYNESRPDAPAAVVTPEPSQGATFTLTPGLDLAGTTSASNAGIASDFRFTAGSEKVEAGAGTLQGTDVLLDATTTDNDVLNATLTGVSGTFTAQNIETINANFVNAAADLQLNNVTGTKTVNVSGATAGQVSGLNAQATSPVVAVNGYTNTLTVQAQTFAGTAATNSAETLNLSVSGASWGATAATRTNIVVDGLVNGTLETLNITSTGSTANTFGLTAAAGDSFGAINVKGTADATIRVATGTVTGITVDASGNAGVTTLDIDRNGATTASTNLTNVKGVEQIVFRDSTAGGDALVATNVASGTELTAVSGFGADGSVSVFGAASVADDELKLTLDHATANTAVLIGGLDIQNVAKLNLVSNGFSTATVAAANGNSLTLTGDFAAINLSGDTTAILSYTRDAVTTVGTSNATVDASGMTGTAGANITVIAGGDGAATETFTITGTDNADTIVGGAEGNTINSGAGNDTVTGGLLVDTINTGAGNDRIVTTNAADSITTGTGLDTIAFGAGTFDVDAVSTVVTDFQTGTSATDRDVVEITKATGFGGVANIVANLTNNYLEGTAAPGPGQIAVADNSILVITDTAYANFAAAELAIQGLKAATLDYAVLFLNSSTGFAELWVDADSSAAGAGVQLATFENIVTLTGVASFDAMNFTVV